MIPKTIIWLGFIALFFILQYYSWEMDTAGVKGIVALEFANKVEGKEILKTWQETQLSRRTVLETGRVMTYWDMLYPLFYVSLLIMLSNRQMQRESYYPLNMLLRMNLPVVVLAGLLDYVENGFLLYDMNHPAMSDPYFSTTMISWIKFILLGWAILVWLVSVVKSWLPAKR